MVPVTAEHELKRGASLAGRTLRLREHGAMGFHLSQGRCAERLRRKDVMREVGEIRMQVEERSTVHLGRKEQFKKLFAKGVRNRMGVGMALMFLQSFTGVNIITYYSPRIL